MTSPSDNDKNKDAASDAKASGGEHKADKFASAKETLNRIINKTRVLAGKAYAVAKAATKDVAQELRNVNGIRKETVAAAAEGTKKTDLAKTFWTRTSRKQRGIFLGLTVVIVFVLYSAMSTSGEQYLKEAHDFYKNKNYVKALELYKKSADKGYPRAFYDIGEMHYFGQGAPKNKLEAAKWFGLGAEKGDASAQTSLGIMYRDGEGVVKNNSESVRWLKLAAKQGHPVAQVELSLAYGLGRGVEKDFVRALTLANLASLNGKKDALELRDTLTAAMTTQGIAEAQKQASQCQASKYKNCDALNSAPSSTNVRNQNQTQAPPVQAQPQDTSYTATFTCGMGSNEHLNIHVCFAGSGAPTEIELKNGDKYGLYKVHSLNQIGQQDYEGFKIKLENNFSIRAQNSDKTLVLGLKITGDQTGRVVYQKQVGQYGVLSISN